MATGDVYKLRAILEELRDEYDDPRLYEAIQLTYRSQYKPYRARPNRGSLTPEKAIAIRAFVADNPNLSNRAVGYRFGVDGGRVSEALGSKDV